MPSTSILLDQDALDVLLKAGPDCAGRLIIDLYAYALWGTERKLDKGNEAYVALFYALIFMTKTRKGADPYEDE